MAVATTHRNAIGAQNSGAKSDGEVEPAAPWAFAPAQRRQDPGLMAAATDPIPRPTPDR